MLKSGRSLSAGWGSSYNLLLISSSFSSLGHLLRGTPSFPFHGGGEGGSDLARSMGTLAYEEVGPPEGPRPVSTALVLHGLLGSGRNWRTFARNLASGLANSSSDWRMILVDLRNHGNSAGIGLDPPHDMVNAARDLANLVKSQKWVWPDVVIGHSMGGKVALEFAESCARGDYGEFSLLPKQLWVLDSVPGEVNAEDSDGEVEKVLQTLSGLPSSFPSRKWVVDYMLQLGFSKTLSQWIGTNLKKEGEHVRWAFDLPAAIEMFNSYRERCYWSLIEHPPSGLQIEIVRAENSDRWSPHVVGRLENLRSRQPEPGGGKTAVHVISKSGHWVHVDNPKGLLEIMVPNFFSKARHFSHCGINI